MWIVFEYPETIYDPSVAPGFRVMFSGESRRRFALSNIVSRIGIGIVVIPLSRAVKGRCLSDVVVSLAHVRAVSSSWTSI